MSTPGVKKTEYFCDLLTGDILIGTAGADYHVIDDHIEAGGHPADIEKLATVLGDRTIPLPESPPRRSGGSKQEIINIGRWLLDVMDAGNSADGLRSNIIRRAHALGLIANEHYIASPEMFGSIRNWQREMGLDDIDKRHGFKNLDLDDILVHLQKVADEEGRMPTQEVLWRRLRVDKKVEITPRMIYAKLPLTQALELIGFPNIKNKWDDEEYIQWGVDFTLANWMRLPDRNTIDSLSKKGYGPSTAGVLLRFDKINDYKDKVQEKLEQKMDAIESGLENGSLPPELFIGANSIQEIVPRYMIYELIAKLLPDASPKIRAQIGSARFKSDDFVKAIKRHTPSLSAEIIESQSHKSGCFYYIFPRVDHLANLRLERRKTKPQARAKSRKYMQDNLRARSRLLSKARAIKNSYVGRVRVLETLTLENGFVLKRLESEWSEKPREPGSALAVEAIEIVAEDEAHPGLRKAYTIRHSAGVRNRSEQTEADTIPD